MTIHIGWGSQTGNARNLAENIADQLLEQGFSVKVFDLSDLDPENLTEIDSLLIVTSTYGDGEAPDNASEWHSFLKFADDLSLPNLKFAVLGLGDRYYPHFCQCARDFDEFLLRLGAQRLIDHLECDLYYEEQYGPWLEQLMRKLT